MIINQASCERLGFPELLRDNLFGFLVLMVTMSRIKHTQRDQHYYSRCHLAEEICEDRNPAAEIGYFVDEAYEAE